MTFAMFSNSSSSSCIYLDDGFYEGLLGASVLVELLRNSSICVIIFLLRNIKKHFYGAFSIATAWE